MDKLSIAVDIAKVMTQIAHQHCVAILAMQPGQRPAQCATGTLFQVADRRFLISAGHVVRGAISGKAILAIHNGLPQTGLIPLVEAHYFTDRDEGRMGDESGPFDLAVWPLAENTVEQLTPGKSFVNQASIRFVADMSQLPRDEVYYLCGFPTELAAFQNDDPHHLVLEPIRWIAACMRPEATPPMCDPKYHILLDGGSAIKLNSDATPTVPPKIPRGISGCGIWAVGIQKLHCGTWTPSDPRLIAVQTRVFSKEAAIRGTGWMGVRSILRQEFPELRAALSILPT